MSACPHAGGDYHYLNRAFGFVPAFLYAWARLVVIQTGSIAMVAFLVGDYASEIFRLGPFSSSWYAALTIVFLTAVNVAGIQQGKWTQRLLAAGILFGLLVVSAIGFCAAGPVHPVSQSGIAPGQQALGTAMIFVLLTFGGWNEASFLSAEVRRGRLNTLKVLLYSIATVTAVYLLVNISLLNSLGLPAMASSTAVMADMMQNILGTTAGSVVSLLILLAAVSTMNASIITGARTNYALGRDFPMLGILGRWQERRQTPVNALLVQGGVALALVAWGTGAHDGFVRMVEYTAPVFWLFILMVGVSVILLRRRYPDLPRPFRVPLYPLTPLVFIAICVFMLWASLAFTGRGSWVGVCVLLSGIPLVILAKKRRTADKNE